MAIKLLDSIQFPKNFSEMYSPVEINSREKAWKNCSTSEQMQTIDSARFSWRLTKNGGGGIIGMAGIVMISPYITPEEAERRLNSPKNVARKTRTPAEIPARSFPFATHLDLVSSPTEGLAVDPDDLTER